MPIHSRSLRRYRVGAVFGIVGEAARLDCSACAIGIVSERVAIGIMQATQLVRNC